MDMQIDPLGECAALVTLGAAIDEATHRLVRAAWTRLLAEPMRGTLDLVPGFASIAIHYDPAQRGAPHSFDDLRAELERRLADMDAAELPAARVVEIPVEYGGSAGPDLAHVAEHAGLTPQEVVEIHAGGEYLVHMVGFAPGFPYLGGLDARLSCPRRGTPRTRVPAGSVGIGGSQTGVYPLESPGGWNLIGRTPLVLFDPARDPPALLRTGDRVRFVPLREDGP